MLKENRGLRTLVLDDNPIGQRGGRAILRALARMVELGTAGSRHIDLAHCNMNYTSSEPLFDPEHPGGECACSCSTYGLSSNMMALITSNCCQCCRAAAACRAAARPTAFGRAPVRWSCCRACRSARPPVRTEPACWG